MIPTIEHRFRLSSQRSGLLLSVYDIAAASLVIPISYFGEAGHKPRWLGGGCLIMGIGGLIFALPHVRSVLSISVVLCVKNVCIFQFLPEKRC